MSISARDTFPCDHQFTDSAGRNHVPPWVNNEEIGSRDRSSNINRSIRHFPNRRPNCRSVGPYKFQTSATALSKCCFRSTERASPPDHARRSGKAPSLIRSFQVAGVACIRLAFSRLRTRAIWRPSRTDISSKMYACAPTIRGQNISTSEISKDGVVTETKTSDPTNSRVSRKRKYSIGQRAAANLNAFWATR